MKYINILLLIFFSVNILFCDETSDNKEKKYFIKFRGEFFVSLGYRPQFEQGAYNDHMGQLSINYPRLNDIIFSTDSSYSFIFPFKRAANPLFSINNFKIKLYNRISPATLNQGMEFTITPLAFYNVSFGFKIGTGWAIPFLGNPLGRNVEGEVLEESFLGPIIELYFDNRLQFDFGYLMPKSVRRWGHIIAAASARFSYRTMPTVTYDQPYKWGDGKGESMNGWLLNSRFFLGYRIPIIEDDRGTSNMFLRLRNNYFSLILGMIAEINNFNLSHSLDSLMINKGWGSDFAFIIFGPIVRFDLPRNFFINIVTQFANERRYARSSYENDIYFKNREYEDWYLYLKRIVFNFGMKF